MTTKKLITCLLLLASFIITLPGAAWAAPQKDFDSSRPGPPTLHEAPERSYSSNKVSVTATRHEGGTVDALDDWELRTYQRPERWGFDLRALDHGNYPETTWWGEKIYVYLDDDLVHSGGSIYATGAKTTWTLDTRSISQGDYIMRFKFQYYRPYDGARKLVTLSGYPIKILHHSSFAKLSLYTTTPYIARGQWAKLAGFLTDEYSDGIPGRDVYVRGWFGPGDERWIATATTNTSGYFQYWFRPLTGRNYSVGFIGDGEHNGAVRGFTGIRVSPVSLYTIPSTVTFGWWPSAGGSWAKLAGHMRDDQGIPIAGAKVYIQRKETNGSWSWVATKYTSSTGYYQHWLQPSRTADYMAMVEKNSAIGIESRYWSPEKRVHVRYRTSMTITPNNIALGRWTKIQGTIRPWHTTGKVTVQWWDHGKKVWRYLATTSIDSQSGFTYWYKPPWKGYGNTRWLFRAKVHGHWDHATGYTPTQSLYVN